jgi:hypothetical protein
MVPAAHDGGGIKQRDCWSSPNEGATAYDKDRRIAHERTGTTATRRRKSLRLWFTVSPSHMSPFVSTPSYCLIGHLSIFQTGSPAIARPKTWPITPCLPAYQASIRMFLRIPSDHCRILRRFLKFLHAIPPTDLPHSARGNIWHSGQRPPAVSGPQSSLTRTRNPGLIWT